MIPTSAEFLEKRFAKNPYITSQEAVDEVILIMIRPENNHLEDVFSLNNVAGRIWQLLDGRQNVAEIKATIISEFDVPPEDAEADLMAFIQHLEAVGAVNVV